MRKNYLDASKIKDLEDNLVTLKRVTKVVKGGRTFSFSALVVVGNRKGVVGLGFGKAKDIPEAIRKASEKAKKTLIKINLQNSTIPYQTKAKYCASKVVLFPASEGTGVIAGGNIRSILQYAGVENILSKTYGSRNVINSSKCAFKALEHLRSPIELALEREIDVKNVYN